MKTLLIEDNPISRLVLEKQFRSLGHEVTSCVDAESALTAYQQTRYPLIALDLGLPGMNGLEFCRQIRALPQGDSSMILVITAWDRPEDIQAALEAGADDYLVKPVNMGLLRVRLMIIERRLSNYIQRKRAEEDLRASEGKYRLISENIPVVVYSALPDEHSTNLFVSGRIEKLTGYSNQQFLEAPELWTTIVHPEDRKYVWEKIEEHRKQRSSLNVEYRIIAKNNCVKWVRDTATPLLDKNGQIIRIDGFMEDITDRKLAEEELKASREQLRNLSAHLQAVREEERTTIAREIHDELGQTLTALKFDVSWLKKRFADDQTALLEKTDMMETLINSTIQTVKRISAELRPGLLDDLGLSAAIEWQTEEFQHRAGIRCDVSIEPEEIIVKEALSTAVFRIFQETLTNVARHADATKIYVLLRKTKDKLLLEVRDNGKGITEKQIAAPTSFGLIGIRERAQFLGGQVTFQGIPNEGTTVTVTIPF